MVLEPFGYDEDAAVRDDVAQTVAVGAQFVILDLVALVTARPFLFPSLGPSAYLLATDEGEDAASSAPYYVVGGHVVAVVAGTVSYHLLTQGLVVTNVLGAGSPTVSAPILRLALASVLGMLLTTIGMLATDANHPAACATTLIVTLGLLTSLAEAGSVVLAVVGRAPPPLRRDLAVVSAR